MAKTHLLIVEDDVDIANMLKIYFGGMSFDVDIAYRGSDALEKTRHALPQLIVLDIMLPELDGLAVCRRLRARGVCTPILMLTARDGVDDRVAGLDAGADDYITKPFDIEELKLRVQGAIRRSERESLTDPRSGLPAGRLIEEQLRRIIREKDWALLDLRVNYLEPFKDVYGFVAGDDVLRFTAMLITEVVDELGTDADFIGHAGSDSFIVITTDGSAAAIKQRIKDRFAAEVQTHYNFMDRLQGFMPASKGNGVVEKVPFMTMSVGIVSPSQQSFADIREITELAAEARRQDASPAG